MFNLNNFHSIFSSKTLVCCRCSQLVRNSRHKSIRQFSAIFSKFNYNSNVIRHKSIVIRHNILSRNFIIDNDIELNFDPSVMTKMELKLNKLNEFSVILAVAKALDLDLKVTEDSSISDAVLKSGSGGDVEFTNAILRYLGELKADSTLYGGLSVSEKAEIDGWLSFVDKGLTETSQLSSLENHLKARTFLVDTSTKECSLADIVVILKMIEYLVGNPAMKADALPVNQTTKKDSALSKWIDRCMASNESFRETLIAILEGYRNKVAELKKAKQPVDEILPKMLKMKAIIGDLKPGGIANVPAPQISNKNLGRIAEEEKQESKEVDPEKEAKKAAKKAEKAKKDAEKAARKAAEEERKKGKSLTTPVPEFRLTADFPKESDAPYGNIFIQSEARTRRNWLNLGQLKKENEGTDVWIRGRLQSCRVQGKAGAFLIIRQNLSIAQAFVDAKSNTELHRNLDSAGALMVGFCKELTDESVVDLHVTVTKPPAPLKSDQLTIHDFELQVRRIYRISKSGELPFMLADASRKKETDQERKDREENEISAGKEVTTEITVKLETRLNNRILDLRTNANQAIMRIQSGVCWYFREFLHNKGLVEIHSPKLLAGGSEGGSEVFKVDYFSKYNLPNAFLAQSPQLYKQMALMTDLPGVFEIGPIFRAEDSFTHRHMTEFTGLDLEMHFTEHYHEVLDVIDQTFLYIFDKLNENYQRELEAVRKQYPFADLKYPTGLDGVKGLSKRFTFKEAIELLRAEGPKVAQEQIMAIEKKMKECKDEEEIVRLMDVSTKAMEHKSTLATKPYLEDISTKDEKLLGEIIKRKYNTEFYIIDKFPAVVRPFYTMPDSENPDWSNSYDVFLRGEEIMSGAQRIHDPELLMKLSKEKGMVPDQDYVNSFALGAFPHAGGGVGMERVVMLFLGLEDIRQASMFPRDPKRLSP